MLTPLLNSLSTDQKNVNYRLNPDIYISLESSHQAQPNSKARTEIIAFVATKKNHFFNCHAQEAQKPLVEGLLHKTEFISEVKRQGGQLNQKVI